MYQWWKSFCATASDHELWTKMLSFVVCITRVLAQSAVACSIHVNDFICTYIERVTSHKRKIASWVAVRGESGVAGEGRVVGVPMFHSWGNCTMPLTSINSDWMSNASSGLCINLFILCYIIYTGPLVRIFGYKYYLHGSCILHLLV